MRSTPKSSNIGHIVLVSLVVLGCGAGSRVVVDDASGSGTSNDTPTGDSPAGSSDVSADDGSSGDGSIDSSGGADPTGDQPALPVRFDLTRVVENAPWEIVQDAAGIAVDASERLYVADSRTLWLVEHGVVTSYLDAADGVTWPLDVDVDAAGRVYVLDHHASRIVVSDGPHTFMPYRDLADVVFPAHFGVIDMDRIAMINWYDGLWEVTASDNTLVYDDTMVLGGTNCATEDFAVQSNGAFLYQPGCNGSPIVLGSIDGSGALVTYGENDVGSGMVVDARCTTRAPGGGFYAIANYGAHYPGVVYIPEGSVDASSWTFIATSPTLEDLKATTTQTFAFDFCALALSPSSTLYLQTIAELWIGTPTF